MVLLHWKPQSRASLSPPDRSDEAFWKPPQTQFVPQTGFPLHGNSSQGCLWYLDHAKPHWWGEGLGVGGVIPLTSGSGVVVWLFKRGRNRIRGLIWKGILLWISSFSLVCVWQCSVVKKKLNETKIPQAVGFPQGWIEGSEKPHTKTSRKWLRQVINNSYCQFRLAWML